MQMLKILYFIDGNVATPAQVHEAKTTPARVQFRNAQVVKTPLEKADGVMGEVPKLYADYPTLSQALAKQKELIEKETEALAEKLEPKTIPDEPKKKVEKKEKAEKTDSDAPAEKKSWGGK